MKTAISLPDDVFEQADSLAKRMKMSRSQLYSRALIEYVARHAPDVVTEALDRLSAELGVEPDEFVSTTSRRVLERTEW
jgi:predicted transcriptional regulator